MSLSNKERAGVRSVALPPAPGRLLGGGAERAPCSRESAAGGACGAGAGVGAGVGAGARLPEKSPGLGLMACACDSCGGFLLVDRCLTEFAILYSLCTDCC